MTARISTAGPKGSTLRPGCPPAAQVIRAFLLALCTGLIACNDLLSFVPAARAGESLPRTSPSFVIDHWDAEDGLPQNEVTAIVQTRDGYLWLGTPSGLVRFDGVRFIVHDESNTPGLNSSRVVSLFEDSQGNLWVGTEFGGVVLFNNGRATSLPLGHDPENQRLASACEDESGAVWLYMMNGALWRYSQGKATPFRFGANPPSDYRSVIRDAAGIVWVGTDSGIVGIDPKSEFKAPDLPLVPGPTLAPLNLILAARDGGIWALAANRVSRWTPEPNSADRQSLRPEKVWVGYPWGVSRVTAACEDAQGNLIVATRDSALFRFDANGEPFAMNAAQGLSSDHILSLCSDRTGNLWVGTDGGGLNRIAHPVFDVLPESKGAVVQSVSADAEGGLWIGYNGRAVSYWKDGTLKQYNRQYDPYVRTVFVDREERVWGGTWGAGLVQFRNGQFQPSWTNSVSQRIAAIHQDRQGRLWVGTERELVLREGNEWRVFNSTAGLSDGTIQAIADDEEGNIWIGTVGGGLGQLHGGRITLFRKSESGLPSDNVSSLYVDQQGTLWIGTDGGGLARLKGGKWTRYSRRDGLASNTISYMIEDNQGFLWIGSNSGLMRVRKEALNQFAEGFTNFVPVRVYSRLDGLPTRECTMGSAPGCWRSPNGRLWFATIQGLVSIMPSEVKINTRPPPVAIDLVKVDGETQNPARLVSPNELRLPSNKEHIEIHYSSLNLSAPERVRFKYWLEGHQKDWTDAGSDSVAHYSKLPAGDYQFHLTACNEDGVWNPAGASFAFTVLPPFWQTPLFLGTTGALILIAVTALVHYFSTQKLQRQLAISKQREALEKERARIAGDIHDQLGASLTQVALLGELVESDKDAPAEVEAHARQISQTARDTTRVLDEIVWAVNPANDTLDGLVTYICKHAQEYLEIAGIHYRFDVPSELPNTPIPPELRHNLFLVCKEAITNVVRHAKATEVWLRLKLERDAFTLEIEDNGLGLAGMDEKAAQLRNGLRNMHKRMESVGGAFAFGPGTGKGARVSLTAPLPRAHE